MSHSACCSFLFLWALCVLTIPWVKETLPASDKPFPFPLFPEFSRAGRGSAASRTCWGVCTGSDTEKRVRYGQNKWQKVMKFCVDIYFVQPDAFFLDSPSSPCLCGRLKLGDTWSPINRFLHIKSNSLCTMVFYWGKLPGSISLEQRILKIHVTGPCCSGTWEGF